MLVLGMAMKKLIIIGNISSSTRVFRAEMLEKLVKTYAVWLICQFTTEDKNFFSEMGVKCVDIKIDRRGKNPFKDMILFMKYLKCIKEIDPDLVLTFTIKPNIYAGIVCQFLKIKYIATVEGLGTIFNTDASFVDRCIQRLYKFGIEKAEYVFYLNNYIRDELLNLGILKSILKYTPGMGVNLDKFKPQPYPPESPFRILTIGRIMKEKGIGDILAASDELVKIIPDLEWKICGLPEKGEEYWLEAMEKRPWIKYYGQVKDPSKLYSTVAITVTATTYREGLSTVCIESSACARPVLGTAIPGVQEVIHDGVDGFIIQPHNVTDIVAVVTKFFNLDYSKKEQMGLCAYENVCQHYNRRKVIDIYEQSIINVLNH